MYRLNFLHRDCWPPGRYPYIWHRPVDQSLLVIVLLFSGVAWGGTEDLSESLALLERDHIHLVLSNVLTKSYLGLDLSEVPVRVILDTDYHT